MPCRALGAFGRNRVCAMGPALSHRVLMPCRALGAFGHSLSGTTFSVYIMSLNALSGIGCVRTWSPLPTAPHRWWES